jgi:hypothetical protein
MDTGSWVTTTTKKSSFARSCGKTQDYMIAKLPAEGIRRQEIPPKPMSERQPTVR